MVSDGFEITIAVYTTTCFTCVGRFVQFHTLGAHLHLFTHQSSLFDTRKPVMVKVNRMSSPLNEGLF
jgi:hypothetical protein